MRGSASSERAQLTSRAEERHLHIHNKFLLVFIFKRKQKPTTSGAKNHPQQILCTNRKRKRSAHENRERETRRERRHESRRQATAKRRQRHTNNRETSRPAQTGFFFLALFLDYWLFACIFGSFSSSASQIRLKSCFPQLSFACFFLNALLVFLITFLCLFIPKCFACFS